MVPWYVFINTNSFHLCHSLEQSPIGTVQSTQSSWHVVCTKAVNRPTDHAYIRFYDASNNAQVYAIDASTDTANVLYSNFTLIFYSNYAWTPVSLSQVIFVFTEEELFHIVFIRVTVIIFYLISKLISSEYIL